MSTYVKTEGSMYTGGVTASKEEFDKTAVNKTAIELFYQKIFPVAPMFNWVTYGCRDEKRNRQREFCLTLYTPTDEEIFARYKACGNVNDFKKLLVDDRTSNFVGKIDIGPVMSQDVSMAASFDASEFTAQERELVFDIDMDEYDSVRTCCQGKKVCAACFHFLGCAAKVIDTVMRDDFGFQHILYVFSGRRGLHAWVCDRTARRLNYAQRNAVVEYLNLATEDPEKMSAEVLSHETIRRCTALLHKEFPALLRTQTFFDDPRDRLALLDKFSGTTPRPLVAAKTGPSAEEQWKGIKFGSSLAGDRIVLHYLYPRLDIEVSKHVNHLLKSPFCIHPKTGKVCVPLTLDMLDTFDPDTVPTLGGVLNEYNSAPPATTASASTTAPKTSLSPYLDLFNRFVERVIAAEQIKGGSAAASAAAAAADDDGADFDDEEW